MDEREYRRRIRRNRIAQEEKKRIRQQLRQTMVVCALACVMLLVCCLWSAEPTYAKTNAATASGSCAVLMRWPLNGAQVVGKYDAPKQQWLPGHRGVDLLADAQYDSELVYHNVRKEVEEQGVIYTDMESALTGEYADMVKDHFMKLVTPHDHKFAALHGAVWSGGSFVYVPKGVSVEIPLQSYFRLNAAGAGQFEHTLIIVDEGASLHFIEGCSAPKYNVANLHAGCVELYIGKNARLRYSTIENWSKNMYNLNTKRAKVEEGGVIEWVSGSFGSHVSYLYPMSVLNGEGARSEFTGITFAGKGQNLDTGCKVVHNAPKTSSYVNTKSISKDGGISTFRSSVVVSAKAKGSKSAVSCQSLMLDDISRSDTIPAMDIRTKDADVGHEAKIGRISDDAVFYLMSRGISEEDARALIVSGFADNVSKELPLEYAVEMNNLIHLEMKGSIG